jgi:nucleotide-binding universal stress UspA family protein
MRISSPGVSRGRAQLCAIRLIASVVPRTNTTSSIEDALMNRRTDSRAPSYDAVARCDPDHILLALRSPAHANWQERRIVAQIEHRYGLPVTTYAVDTQGHTSAADGPLLLCYDGSEDAEYAIRRAGDLFAGRRSLVLTVWQPTSVWLGATDDVVDVFASDRAADAHAQRVADEGVRIARDAGLQARPLAVEASGPVWKTIVDVADRHDAQTIVLGSRGLTGVRSALLQSVSSAAVRHADRPTLVVRRPPAAAYGP